MINKTFIKKYKRLVINRIEEKRFKKAVISAIDATINQGKQSIIEEGSCVGKCVYLSACGNKCTVGHMIEKKHYRQYFENYRVNSICIIEAVGKSIKCHINDKRIEILKNLQIAHDTSSNHPDKFVERYLQKLNEQVELGILPEYCINDINYKGKLINE